METRHLAKYIFPGQYGLPSPFQSLPGKKEVFPYPDYFDREKEIEALGPRKTPKRLREALAGLDQMIWRHKKCSYKALRDIACSSKIRSEDGKQLDSSVILELVSETSMQLNTQPSLRLNEISDDSAGFPISAAGGTQAKAHAKIKARFVEFACSHTEVFRYVALVTKAVIPMGMWGNKQNFHHILKVVKRYITCRRYETISLHYILQGFSTSACEWLAPSGERSRAQKRVSVSDSLKRRELLEEFVFWYFDQFVTPLLKTTFYITESSAFRNLVLYFRQDDWKVLCEPLVERLANDTFERIADRDVQDILLQRSLGFSFVRLLPKETGVRPIVNLRKKKPMGGVQDRSINQILAVAFQILSYEKTNAVERLGASVFGADQIYIKLKEFKSRIRKPDGTLPKMYFVKLDVQACFDTIDQPRLLEILKELISSDGYMAEKYGQVHFSQNRIKRAFPRRAAPIGQETDFIETARELAAALRNIIFVDQPGYPIVKKEAVLKLLEEHITENMVKIGRNYYRQKVGIPQGSVMSAILCAFFYGDLERRKLRIGNDKESTLMRFTDDYLFVTTNLAKATVWLDTMNQGHPEYGCFISREKTLTNFHYNSDLSNNVDPRSTSFPWCGRLISMKDLSVTYDYSRYDSWGLKNTLTIERGRAPGTAFQHKMTQFACARNHILYSDATLNSSDIIYLNIYQNFLLTAYKMQEHIRDGGLRLGKNSSFVYKTIQRTIETSYASVIAQGMRKPMDSERSRKPSHVKKLAVFWLGNHAFRHVLSKKPHGYGVILRNLERQLGKLCNRFYKRKFKRLVMDGQAAFDFMSSH